MVSTELVCPFTRPEDSIVVNLEDGMNAELIHALHTVGPEKSRCDVAMLCMLDLYR
jgi:hypothetical protein